MKKNNNEVPLPLRLVKHFDEKFPGAYEWVDIIATKNILK